MSFREQNLSVLTSRSPEVSRAVEAGAGSAPNLEVLRTPRGDPTAKLDGIFLHGRHDPGADAGLQVRREIDPACTTIIAIGFGLGYGVQAVQREFPGIPLLVVEPDARLFAEALAVRDLRSLLSDPAIRLHVGAGPEHLPALLEGLPTARPAFLRLRPLLRLRPGPYRAAEETIQSWLLRREINLNTLNRFGRLWVRNLCRNMNELLRCPGVGRLRGRFEGVPALVIAGGPSLDRLVPHLPDLRERMLVVSVNTPARACRQAGVEPDFTVVVDPQFWASRSLDWTPAGSGVLVAEPSTCPRVFRRERDRFFLCSSLFPLGETLERAVGEKGKLGAGGSVTTSAWDLARLLGARPLFAAGLDLGFPGMRAHCKGTYPHTLWMTEADRLAPVESRGYLSIRDIGIFLTRSADGGTTPTDRRMLLYKWWFENQIRMYPQVPCRTLSPGSASVEGMPLASVEEALALPKIRAGIEEAMQEVRRIHDAGAESVAARERLAAALGTLGQELSDLEELAHQGRRLSIELAAGLEQGRDPASCLRKLDGIDESILAISSRAIAGFLLQSLIHGVLGEGERRGSPRGAAYRGTEVYAAIADSAGWQGGLIRRALEGLPRDGQGPGALKVL